MNRKRRRAEVDALMLTAIIVFGLLALAELDDIKKALVKMAPITRTK